MVNAVAIGRIGIEVRANTQGFAAVFDLDNQIIRLTTHHNIRSVQPFQANNIQLIDCGVVVGVVANGVLAGALAEHISIGAETTVQRIIAAAAIQKVVTIAATQRVIA